MTIAKILKFPWSNGQNWPFMTMTKISKLPWLNGQNWPILTIDHGKYQVVMVMVNFLALFGYIPGELSFAANSRELERIRANSGELRANSPAVRRHPHSGELRRTFAGVRRTFAGVRRSSLGFARVRAYSAANWRTVRQKIRSPEEIPTTSNERSPRTRSAANVVRRERGSPRTTFAHGELQFTEKRILDVVNDRSPRTDVR